MKMSRKKEGGVMLTHDPSAQFSKIQPQTRITKKELSNSSTKLDRVKFALRSPAGLNRFEAERIGDHCLNSTVSEIRRGGEDVFSEWETVPSRFSDKGVRVLRYRMSQEA